MGDKCEICEQPIEDNEATGYLGVRLIGDADGITKVDLVHQTCWLNAQVLVAKYSLLEDQPSIKQLEVIGDNGVLIVSYAVNLRGPDLGIEFNPPIDCLLRVIRLTRKDYVED